MRERATITAVWQLWTWAVIWAFAWEWKSRFSALSARIQFPEEEEITPTAEPQAALHSEPFISSLEDRLPDSQEFNTCKA